MMYKRVLTRQAVKDSKLVENAGLKPKVAELLGILRADPFQTPPPYEKLVGVKDTYSRRINIRHRLVYQVLKNESCEPDENEEPYQGIVKVIRMWTHYA
jgi:Txe/YoeB family toxin of toxin-antitoxin system